MDSMTGWSPVCAWCRPSSQVHARRHGAKERKEEAMLALDEWIENGENSMAFRLASWRDQHSAQGDLNIAMDGDSSFMAFLINKAVSNRRAFVCQLKQTVESSDFCDAKFLSALEAMLGRMHSLCLRLKLLQLCWV